MDIYIEMGYKNRIDYLKSLADIYGVPYQIVGTLAEALGEDEDFDGLVTSLEDCYDDFN